MASSVVTDLEKTNLDYYEEMEVDEGFGGSPDADIQTSNENGTYYDHNYSLPPYIFPTGIDNLIPQTCVPQISVPSNEPIPASLVTWLDLSKQ